MVIENVSKEGAFEKLQNLVICKMSDCFSYTHGITDTLIINKQCMSSKQIECFVQDLKACLHNISFSCYK